MDLNKILFYADKNGHIHDEIQRKTLNIGDMIISGEKEGPVAVSYTHLQTITYNGSRWHDIYISWNSMCHMVNRIICTWL